jgi:WD40 repeat protein
MLPPTAPEDPLPESPYLGLEPYSERTKVFFRGRETQVRIIAANLLASRTTVLYGASGVGKTSTLQAGVVPAVRSAAEGELRESGQADAVVGYAANWTGDPSPRILEAVAETADRLGLSTEGFGARSDPIHERLAAFASREQVTVALILDQFEEWFLYHARGRTRAPFEDLLLRLILKTGVPVHIMLSLREDALADLDRFRPAAPRLFANLLRLNPLDRAGAREAIEEPIKSFNRATGRSVGLDPGLVDAVLDQTTIGEVHVGQRGFGAVPEAADDKGPGIEMSFLSLVMRRIWDEEMAQASDALRLATLDRLGGAQRIVRTHFEATMAALTADQRDAAVRIFDYLITPSGKKIAQSGAALAGWAKADPATLATLTHELSLARILRQLPSPEGSEDDPQFELFHDMLAPAILDWRDRALEEERRRDLTASLAAARSRQRRLALGSLVGLIVAVVIVVLVVTNHIETTRAIRAGTRSRANQAAARALVTLTADPLRGIEQALAAMRIEPTPAAAVALRSGAPNYLSLRAVIRLPAPPVWTQPVSSHDLATFAGGVLRTFDLDGGPVGGTRIGRFQQALPVGASGRVVTLSANGTVGVWDALRNQRLSAFTAGGSPETLAVSPNGAEVLTEGRANMLFSSAGHLLGRLPHRPIQSASFSRDGRLLLVLSSNGQAMIWKTTAHRLTPLARLDGPRRALSAILSPGRGARFVLFDKRRRVVLLNRLTQTSATLLPGSGRLDSAAFDPSGKHVVTTSESGIARIFDARTGALMITLNASSGAVKDALFSPDGALVATVANDGTARLWSSTTGAAFLNLTGHSAPLTTLSFGPEGTLVATTDIRSTIDVWQVEPTLKASGLGTLKAAQVDPRGRRVAFASTTRGVGLWDLATRRISWLTPRSGKAVAFSPNGGYLATAEGKKGRVDVRELAQPKRVLNHELTSRTLHDIAFSRDGSRIITATQIGAQLWSWRASRAPVVALTHEPAYSAAFTSAGRGVILGEGDGRFEVRQTPSNKVLARARFGEAPITSLAVSNTKPVIALGSEGRAVAVYSLRTRGVVASLPLPSIVFEVNFSPNGRLVAIATSDGEIRVWDWHANQLLTTLDTHAGPNRIADFLAGSPPALLSGGDDGILSLTGCETCLSINRLKALLERHGASLRPRP